MRMQFRSTTTDTSRAAYEGMGMCKAVKGANAHHDKGSQCESEKVQVLKA